MKTFGIQLIVIILLVSMIGCSSSTVITETSSNIDDTGATETVEIRSIDSEPVETLPMINTTDKTVNIADSSVIEANDVLNGLDEVQKNSIAMLNYLNMISQEINESKNSKLLMEEKYSWLINETNPETVNELSQSRLASLLDIIENYRMIDVKRERLQYMYEQNKAKALRSAIPNPAGLLSAAVSCNWVQLVTSVAYMTVDSISSYEACKEELNQQFLTDGWELDDEEAENLHENRKDAFDYMLSYVREENLPGNLALNEKSIENFVKWKNNDNVASRIQFFEDEVETYKAFGNYWLALADSYYENGDYQKCLNAIANYESLNTNIFRKDYYFAKTLPNVIASIGEVYSGDEYVTFAEEYAKKLYDNTYGDEWALRLFVSQVYIDLYTKTSNDDYLKQAYNIILSNVNFLIDEQKSLNEVYLSDVKEVEPSETASKQEKKEIKEYNKSLKEKRKTELPSTYEPLELNCESLIALANKLNISDSEKEKINGILRGNDGSVFLSKIVDEKYEFIPSKFDIKGEYVDDELIIPAYYLTDDSYIVATAVCGTSTTTYDDWIIKAIDREGTEFDTFKAKLSSDSISKQEWNEKATIEFKIFENKDSESEPIVLKFKVSKYVKNWYLIGNTIEFELVK